MVMGGDFRLFFIFLGFCFQAQFLNSQNLPCNPNDFTALQGFNQGLVSGIDGWGNASTDCCSWFGVVCGNSSRVTGLDLGNQKLKGIVSNLLAGLNELIFLNLSRNSLSGEVPLELFHLKNLKVLDLSYNKFNGSITEDIDLPSIVVFNISFNLIGGSHPTLFRSANLSHFDISFNQFTGLINTSICKTSTQIQVLQFSVNLFSGKFPVGFGNCQSLRELFLDWNYLSGTLPDDLFSMPSLKHLDLQGNELSGPLNEKMGNLSSLVDLDLSVNRFNGSIPDVFGQLGRLQHLSAHSNFFSGPLPNSLLNSPSLHGLDLRNNSLSGNIDHLNCTAMVNLSSLDLGSNQFQGLITDGLSNCTELKKINLARNDFHGQIPDSFQNLKSLSFLSLSNNSFENIMATLGILQHCRKLTSLVLTMNFRNEELPVDGITGFDALQILIIPYCSLTGSIPSWLEICRNLRLLDLSWNHLNGNIPPWLGSLDSLFYLDLSNNSLTGEIPKNLTQLKSLISPNNSMLGSSLDFPFFTKRNQSGRGLQYNQVSSFPPTLDLCYNNLTGAIWPEFGNLQNLHVFDLGNNKLSGTIPDELSGMKSLELLDLSFNNLSGTIPASLTDLTFLSSFSVAYNRLSGQIPVRGQFLTFPNSSFEGNLNLCGPHFLTICLPRSPKSSIKIPRNKGVIVGMAIGIGLGTILFLALIFYLVSRTLSRKRQDDDDEKEEETSKHLEPLGSSLVVLFQNKDNKELTIDDLLTSTNSFDQSNIIGCGGFGLVYKATLPDGRKVAIKRLSGDSGQMEREFQAEVETLSRAQHENLVRLQGYCRYGNDRLLIYSYMENGSLDYWLHEKLDGGSSLDWDTRLEIAQGAARGLAYLHQSCQPHILHRDIKSSNILLDENFQAHLADFGLARVILPYDTHVSTDLVGTLGYIPPEYGQASVATFKGDVYSFGVVLLELLTGKRPMDVCKPRGCRDMISWVLQMKKEKREAEVFDPFIYDKQHDKQMLQVLEIACLCLNECPRARPLIQHIVSCLDNIGLN